jgi:tRNA nucleotidyltransferase (CCA-adding enzyme)
MDFGKEDFDLLTKMKEIIRASDWEELMERRLDVIQRNVMYTESGHTKEAKGNELEALKKYAYMITLVAPDRINKEIMKTMAYDKPSIFFQALHDTGVLKYILPKLEDCYTCDGGVHHGETVFEHCMQAGDNISKKYPLLRLAGYLHDIGKPETFVDGKFVGHEDVNIFDELDRLKFSHDDITYITRLMRVHMRSLSDNTKPKAVRKLLLKFSDLDISYHDFIRLRISDSKSNERRSPMTYSEIKAMCVKVVDEYNRPHKVTAKSDLAVTGFDVMEVMHISPGKEVGDILKELTDITVDDPEKNTFEELILILLKMKERI